MKTILVPAGGSETDEAVFATALAAACIDSACRVPPQRLSRSLIWVKVSESIER